MSVPVNQIRADFDRIAAVTEEGWEHNDHYHRFLLNQLPPRISNALEIGCGAGAFSLLLAAQSDHVLALDLSPVMIQAAKERSEQHSNIDFQVADILSWPIPVNEFDCITSIATLHHLPLEETLSRLALGLKPGGVLLVLDLYQEKGLGDVLTSLLATPTSLLLNLIYNRRFRRPIESRQAWAEHGRHDSYMPLAEIRRVCSHVLPDAQVRKHLIWRYSIIWHKA